MLEKNVDNAYFEQFLETSDEWISKMTGIKERHWADEDQDTSDWRTMRVLKQLKMLEFNQKI